MDSTAVPGRRVHIPARDEIRRFCADGRFTECPVNQGRGSIPRKRHEDYSMTQVVADRLALAVSL
jgi:hypothetical protein